MTHIIEQINAEDVIERKAKLIPEINDDFDKATKLYEIEDIELQKMIAQFAEDQEIKEKIVIQFALLDILAELDYIRFSEWLLSKENKK